MNEIEFPQGQYASFLVRLWRSTTPEPAGPRTDWHGELEHIQSGRRAAFASVSELCELLFQPLGANESILRQLDEIENSPATSSATIAGGTAGDGCAQQGGGTMKFIALFNLKDNVDQIKLAEIIARRIDYVHPVKPIAEYHSPRKSPCVVAVYETEDCERLIVNSAAWIDAFDIDVFPVEDWMESIEKLGQFFAGD